jgi:hypothetical protein
MKFPRRPRFQVKVDWFAVLAALRSLDWAAITRLVALIGCLTLVKSGQMSSCEFIRDVLPILVGGGARPANVQCLPTMARQPLVMPLEPLLLP